MNVFNGVLFKEIKEYKKMSFRAVFQLIYKNSLAEQELLGEVRQVGMVT